MSDISPLMGGALLSEHRTPEANKTDGEFKKLLDNNSNRSTNESSRSNEFLQERTAQDRSLSDLEELAMQSDDKLNDVFREDALKDSLEEQITFMQRRLDQSFQVNELNLKQQVNAASLDGEKSGEMDMLLNATGKMAYSMIESFSQSSLTTHRSNGAFSIAKEGLAQSVVKLKSFNTTPKNVTMTSMPNDVRMLASSNLANDTKSSVEKELSSTRQSLRSGLIYDAEFSKQNLVIIDNDARLKVFYRDYQMKSVKSEQVESLLQSFHSNAQIEKITINGVEFKVGENQWK